MKENAFLLMDYMQSKHSAPTADFLEIIVEICCEMESNLSL